jgi:hypothetical protein
VGLLDGTLADEDSQASAASTDFLFASPADDAAAEE